MRVLGAMAAVLCGALAIADDQPAATPPESVQFDGQTLVLAWQGGNAGESVKEFIPAGQNLDSWTHLASIREYSKLDDPKALAGALVRQLKEKYPLSPSAIIENPQTGEAIVDFVVWPQDGSFVEFNVFKYGNRPGGGVRAEQYARREYENPEAFLKGLRPIRQRLVEEMTRGLQRGRQPVEVKTKSQ
jgi:hypothetical protein